MVRIRGILAGLGLAGVLALAGCAATSLSYPSTANIDRITQKTLTPAEQKAAIEDLQGSAGSQPQATPLIKATTSGITQ